MVECGWGGWWGEGAAGCPEGVVKGVKLRREGRRSGGRALRELRRVHQRIIAVFVLILRERHHWFLIAHLLVDELVSGLVHSDGGAVRLGVAVVEVIVMSEGSVSTVVVAVVLVNADHKRGRFWGSGWRVVHVGGAVRAYVFHWKGISSIHGVSLSPPWLVNTAADHEQCVHQQEDEHHAHWNGNDNGKNLI